MSRQCQCGLGVFDSTSRFGKMGEVWRENVGLKQLRHIEWDDYGISQYTIILYIPFWLDRFYAETWWYDGTAYFWRLSDRDFNIRLVSLWALTSGTIALRVQSRGTDLFAFSFLPTDGIGWVSSPFGTRGSGFHKGIDIACNEGTPIHAVESGIITSAIGSYHLGNWTCGGGYGNVVYVDRQRIAFDQTRYAHLSRLASGIEIGREIKKGAVVGYCGNTGHSFGNHFHFETRISGVAKNPLSFINPIV